jgi:hypothetical protein
MSPKTRGSQPLHFDAPITLPRRSALTLLGAAAVLPPRLHAAATPDPAIRLCQQLEDTERRWTALCEADGVVPDRGPERRLFEAVTREWFTLERLIYQLPAPTTAAGAATLARLALFLAPTAEDGTTLQTADLQDWAALHVAKFVAGSETIMLLPPRPGAVLR